MAFRNLGEIFEEVFKPQVEYGSYYFNIKFDTLEEALKLLKILESFGLKIASCQENFKLRFEKEVKSVMSKRDCYISVNVTDLKRGDKDVLLLYWFTSKEDYNNARRYTFMEGLNGLKKTKMIQRGIKKDLKGIPYFD